MCFRGIDNVEINFTGYPNTTILQLCVATLLLYVAMNRKSDTLYQTRKERDRLSISPFLPELRNREIMHLMIVVKIVQFTIRFTIGFTILRSIELLMNLTIHSLIYDSIHAIHKIIAPKSLELFIPFLLKNQEYNFIQCLV